MIEGIAGVVVVGGTGIPTKGAGSSGARTPGARTPGERTPGERTPGTRTPATPESGNKLGCTPGTPGLCNPAGIAFVAGVGRGVSPGVGVVAKNVEVVGSGGKICKFETPPVEAKLAI